MNLAVDPANLFTGSKYEKGISTLLLQGENVTNLSNYDERLVQKYYVGGLTQPRQIVVFGSSRAMMISSDMFPGRVFFNNSVSGATLEDHVAIYELYRERNLRPALMILELDPWLLNRYNGQVRWKSLENEYRSASKRFSGTHSSLTGFPWASTSFGAQGGKLLELISPSYFQASIKALWQASKTGQYTSTTDQVADTQIKRTDGSIGYDRKTRSMRADEVRSAAIAYVEEGSVYSLERFVALDPEYKNQLQDFLGALQTDGIRVVILLAPYHPDSYSRLIESNKYKIIVDAQHYFEQLAKSRGIPVMGSFSPADCGCNEADFYDGMHPKESCVRKILANQDQVFVAAGKTSS